MAWSDPINADTDLAQIDFVKDFWAAVNERLLLVGYTAFLLPEVGAKVASAKVPTFGLYYVPTSSTDDFPLGSLQTRLKEIMGLFVGDLVDGLGPDAGYAALTLSSILPGGDFTRKYPREFASLASDLLSDGTHASAGALARYLDNARVYQWEGSSWTMQAVNVEPDRVVTTGNFQVGDYYGYWLFAELRAAINAMTRIAAGSGIGPGDETPPNTSNNSAVGGGSWTWDWPTAYAQADAAFVVNWGPQQTIITYHGISAYNSPGITSYTAVITSGSSYMSGSVPAHVAGTLRFYAYSEKYPSEWLGEFTTQVSVYDANGLPLVENAWSEFQSRTIASSSVRKSYYSNALGLDGIPNRNDPPPACAPDTGHLRIRGVWITGWLAVFEPAFVYH